MSLALLKNLRYDLPAGIAVFFVAIPLCLGLAHASGAPLLSGLIAGIVGGIIVGTLSASPLSVGGPANGMTALVIMGIQELGSYEAVLVAVILAGLVQMMLCALRAGMISKYIPNSVISGMLIAIGLILIFKQLPHLFGYDVEVMGVEEFLLTEQDYNVVNVHEDNTFTTVFHTLSHINPIISVVGLSSVVILFLWDKAPKTIRAIPGSIVVVIMGAVTLYIYSSLFPATHVTSDHFVNIPIIDGLDSFWKQTVSPDWSMLGVTRTYTLAVTIALIASLETLLSIEAIDKLDPHRRATPPNRELFAQGIGNSISGLLDIADPARNGTLVPEIASLRHQLTLNLGYILPSVRIMDAPSLSPNEYRIVIRDTTVASAEVYADRMLILREDWDNIYSEAPPGSLPGWEPALQEAAYWIDPEYLEQIDWDRPAAPAVRVLTAHLAEVVRKNIDDLLEKSDVRKVLDQVKQFDSQLVDNLVPGAISLGDLRRVFVNLLKERVSIRDIHYILEKLEDLTVAIKDPDQLSEKLRVALGRQICLEFSTPDRQLPAMAFHPSWETRLEQSLQRVDNNMVLILEPKQIQNLVTMISNASRRILEQVERRPILICGPSLRLPLFRLIEQFDPHVHILSYAELSPDFNIQVMETIGTEMDVPAVGGG